MSNSEVVKNRDEAGRFEAPQAFGLAGEEREAGFAPLPDLNKPATSTESDLAEAARRVQERRAPAAEPIVREYRTQNGDGDPIDPKYTITRERFVRDLAEIRSAERLTEEVIGNHLAAEAIDNRRAELVSERPDLVASLGIDASKFIEGVKLPEAEQPAEQPAEKTAEQPKEAKTEAKTAEKANEPSKSADGLDPDLEKALAHPQVRQAIEQEITRVHETEQRADTALQTANHLGQATFAVMFPEMLGPDPVAAFQNMAATNPQRAQACVQVLQAASNIEQQQQQRQQQQANARAYQEQQQFAAYKADQDAKFEELTKGMSREEINGYARRLAVEAGVDEATLVREARANPVLHHAGFQALVIDGLRWRDAVKAKNTVSNRAIPPVLKPGSPRQAAPVSSNASKIQALEKQMATAPGHKHAKLMAQIRQLRTAGARA